MFMKTSNKILLGFLIVVFLVPVYVLMSFKSKIKNNEFKVVKGGPYNSSSFHSGTFKSYRVIKVVAPEGTNMKTDLHFSDSLYYTYNNDGSRDSVRVYNQADTLFVEYTSVTAEKQDNNFYGSNEIYTDIFLPSISHLIIKNAEVTIQPANSPTDSQVNIEVFGTGLINIGGDEESRIDNSQSNAAYKLAGLSLQSMNGDIYLGKAVDIALLNLNTAGTTSVTIEEGAVIANIKGSLSDSSSVKASWKYLKNLLPLTK
jgi:hypothetical protein